MPKHFICLFLNIKWKPKGSMTLLRVESSIHASEKAACGHAYNFYDVSYLKKDKKAIFIWGGNPSYGYGSYEFAIIAKVDHCSVSVPLTDHWYRQKIRGWLQEMFDDWRKPHLAKKLYEDHSIQLSILAWQTTIPKGYKLVRTGTVMTKDDKEFGGSSRGPRFWGSVSWYNVGKKVEKRQGMQWVDQHGKTYRRVSGYIDPLIIRKIK